MRPNLRAAIYGTITVGALLAAESTKSETYPDTIGAVLLAILLVWLADAYSEFTEHQLEVRKAFTLRGFGQALAHELTVMVAAAIPLIVLVVCWAAGVALASAVSAAIWASAVLVVIVELAVGRQAGLRGRALLAHTTLGAVFGVLIIALKLILRQ